MPSPSSSVFIIFGEVFPGGYIQGLLAQAKKHNSTIIYSTMGRRTSEQKLRELNQEELQKKKEELSLSKSDLFINIPLEAGFDLEDYQGNTLVEKINQYGLKTWEDFLIDKGLLLKIKEQARIKFQKQIHKFLKQAHTHITSDTKNIHFIHTMAGGIPRSKLLMAVLNKVLKGRDKRFYSSEKFCSTGLGQASLESFKSVTADSFEDLITETSALRSLWAQKNINTTYTAFGYKGNSILVKDKYQWVAYAPYIQGWAKLELEKTAIQSQENSISANVFNCPEVLTRSSQAFSGIEVFLYPLLNSLNPESSKVILEKIGDLPIIKSMLSELKTNSLNKESFSHYFEQDFSFTNLKNLTDNFFTNPNLSQQIQLSHWPQHNNPQQMHLMIKKTLELNKYTKEETKTVLYTQLSTILIYLAGYHIYKQLNSKLAVQNLTHENLLL